MMCHAIAMPGGETSWGRCHTMRQQHCRGRDFAGGDNMGEMSQQEILHCQSETLCSEILCCATVMLNLKMMQGDVLSQGNTTLQWKQRGERHCCRRHWAVRQQHHAVRHLPVRHCWWRCHGGRCHRQMLQEETLHAGIAP